MGHCIPSGRRVPVVGLRQQSGFARLVLRENSQEDPSTTQK